MYPVNDIFHSIQGEGVFSGTPCTFIRLQGCPVGCPWCDTRDSWERIKPEGLYMSAEDLASKVRHTHVVITGGEPLIHDLDELIGKLRSRDYIVQVETCGAFQWKGYDRPNFVTISPKEAVDFRVVIPGQEFKFVVDGGLTEQVVDKLVSQWLGQIDTISFMPEGSPPTKKSRKRALDFAMSYPRTDTCLVMYSDRLQYILGVK